MKIAPGTILISSPHLEDPNFSNAVIVITALNKKGAMGFVLNKIYFRTLNQLEEFKHSIRFPLLEGGPVDREHLYFIHCQPDRVGGGTLIANNTYIGGNFKMAVTHLNNNGLTIQNIKIFIGYCGWNANELQEEVIEGSWLITNAKVEAVFQLDTAIAWQHLYTNHLEQGL